MEDVLRWSLFILGTCAIAGILVHGIWVSRRSSKNVKDKATDRSSAKFSFSLKSTKAGTKHVQPRFSMGPEQSDQALDDDWGAGEHTLDSPIDNQSKEFDELGLSSVRVVGAKNKPSETSPEPSSETLSMTSSSDIDLDESLVVKTETPPKPVSVAPRKIYASVVTQPKPEYAAAQNVGYGQTGQEPKKDSELPEPPPFLLKKSQPQTDQANDLVLENSPSAGPVEPVAGKVHSTQNASLTEQARNLMHSRKRREPKITEDQLRIDFENDDQPVVEKKPTPDNAPSDPSAQEVLVLNVKSTDSQPIQGSALLPMLLTLGFKFGDQDIFHRHVNSNGKGPVLFSLANMFKPGVFDIDNLENFTTQGVSLFMILPIEGDPHQVFNMMHNAARKIADEFSGKILDGRRSVLTKQGLQQYVERIRDFERKRVKNR